GGDGGDATVGEHPVGLAKRLRSIRRRRQMVQRPHHEHGAAERSVCGSLRASPTDSDATGLSAFALLTRASSTSRAEASTRWTSYPCSANQSEYAPAAPRRRRCGPEAPAGHARGCPSCVRTPAETLRPRVGILQGTERSTTGLRAAARR